jgi:hypothetical protein
VAAAAGMTDASEHTIRCALLFVLRARTSRLPACSTLVFVMRPWSSASARGSSRCSACKLPSTAAVALRLAAKCCCSARRPSCAALPAAERLTREQAASDRGEIDSEFKLTCVVVTSSQRNSIWWTP